MNEITVQEFINRFVGHNSMICIYRHKLIQTKDNGTYHEYPLIWQGMDWQCHGNHDDEEYCERNGFEICPYKNEAVRQIKLRTIAWTT